MEIESTGFGHADLTGFMDQLIDHDRRALVERLERASARLGELGALVPDGAAAGDGGGWNPKDVLAHVAVLSKFYGVVAYRVGSGALAELDLLAIVSQRDVAGQGLAGRTAAELVAMARTEHGRTAEWLRTATPEQLRRRCDIGGGGSLTAEELARLALVSHLEQHVAQLDSALRVRAGQSGAG